MERKANKTLLFIGLLVALFLTQVIIFGVDRDQWFDVSFSLETVGLLKENGLTSINWYEFDAHPPTYYYMLYMWSSLKPSFISEYHFAQQLSVIFFLAFIVFAYYGASKWFKIHGEIAVIILSLLTTYLHYATEVRSYMLLLLISSIAFYSMSRNNTFGVSISMLLLPLVHYIAAIAIPVFAGMHYLINKDWKYTVRKNQWLFTAPLLIGLIGVVLVFPMAMSQQERTDGSWFDEASVTSYPSALFYAFFNAETFQTTIPALIVYAVFLAFMLSVAGFTMLWIMKVKQRLREEEKVWILCILTGFIPLIALVALSLIHSNLYHHRFFIVVTWMFAFACLVLFSKILAKARKFSVIVISIIVLMMIVTMNVQYMLTANTEVNSMLKATPCPERDEEYMVIVHESVFSSVPYEAYARDKGCKWINKLSTAVEPKRLRSAGFDVIENSQEVFWNQTFPEYGFYYVQSYEYLLNLTNRSVRTLAEFNGINLVYVEAMNNG